MTKSPFRLLKSAALVALGLGAGLYAPKFIGPLPFGEAAAPAAESAAAPTAEQAGPKAPSIRVVPAAMREIVEHVSATGSITAREQALVGADVAGLIVEELFFDVGDVVKKGDQLARLDRSNLELQLAQLAAQRAQIDANLEQAKSQTVDAAVAVKQAREQLDRVTPLVKKGIAAKSQLDSANNSLDSAMARAASAEQAVKVVESQVAVLDAQRKQTELQLQKTELLSPVDGIVLSRSAALGQVVSGAAGPLFTIAEGQAFELSAEVAESDLARLAPGMRADVTLPGRSEPLVGEIRLISPQVDARSRLGTVKIALPVEPALRVGSFATGRIELARKTALALPSAAVLYRGRDAYVQKVVGGRVASTDVTLGLRENDFVEIASGLGDGDEVVSRAGTFIGDGDEVTPVRDGEMTGAVQP